MMRRLFLTLAMSVLLAACGITEPTVLRTEVSGTVLLNGFPVHGSQVWLRTGSSADLHALGLTLVTAMTDSAGRYEMSIETEEADCPRFVEVSRTGLPTLLGTGTYQPWISSVQCGASSSVDFWLTTWARP